MEGPGDCIICGSPFGFENKDLVILSKVICITCEKKIVSLKTSDNEYDAVKDKIKALIK